MYAFTLVLCEIKVFRELSLVLCDVLEGGIGVGGRKVPEDRDICRHIADSLCCAAETSITL